MPLPSMFTLPRHPCSILTHTAKITVDDIDRVVTSMLATPVSVAALGQLAKLPSLESIQSALQAPPSRANNAQSNKYAGFMKNFTS